MRTYKLLYSTYGHLPPPPMLAGWVTGRIRTEPPARPASRRCVKLLNHTTYIHPQSIHRVAKAASWRTFQHEGKISPVWWGGGGCTASPFHSIYHHEQSCGARSSWQGRYTPPISPLPSLWFHQFLILCVSWPFSHSNCEATSRLLSEERMNSRLWFSAYVSLLSTQAIEGYQRDSTALKR